MLNPPSCTVAILQPGYLPWLGYFDQLIRADVFVHYDDVQLDKHGWRNRNRIKGITGQPMWLTVPIVTRGLNKPAICDVEIDNRVPWVRKQLGTIEQAYRRAPYFARYWPELVNLLNCKWERVCDLDLAMLSLVQKWLGLQRKTFRSSHMDIGGDRSERLLKICQSLGATRYLSGDSAQDYLDIPLFQRHGITVEWQQYTHPIYSQLHGPFVSHLSVLDLILNCGETSVALLRESSRQLDHI